MLNKRKRQPMTSNAEKTSGKDMASQNRSNDCSRSHTCMTAIQKSNMIPGFKLSEHLMNRSVSEKQSIGKRGGMHRSTSADG